MDRVKLTKYDIELEFPSILKINCAKLGKASSTIKQQILEDYENNKVALLFIKLIEELTMLHKCTISEILELSKEDREKAEKWDLLNDPEGKAFIQSVINMERENKNMKEGLQLHRDALYKEQCLYKMLKIEFEDLAKEDCAIRQKAIKDIKQLKEDYEIMKNISAFYLKETINLKEKLSKIEALKGYDGNFIREQIKAIIAGIRND